MAAPLAIVGVYHTGHFYVRDAFGNRVKLYICLFVCATTRAVHLKVVDKLSATSFIMCLRRLAASKGIPSVILSDNHKTFISGEKFLLDLQEDDIVKSSSKTIAFNGDIRHHAPLGWEAILKDW